MVNGLKQGQYGKWWTFLEFCRPGERRVAGTIRYGTNPSTQRNEDMPRNVMSGDQDSILVEPMQGRENLDTCGGMRRRFRQLKRDDKEGSNYAQRFLTEGIPRLTYQEMERFASLSPAQTYF